MLARKIQDDRQISRRQDFTRHSNSASSFPRQESKICAKSSPCRDSLNTPGSHEMICTAKLRRYSKFSAKFYTLEGLKDFPYWEIHAKLNPRYYNSQRFCESGNSDKTSRSTTILEATKWWGECTICSWFQLHFRSILPRLWPQFCLDFADQRT